jgi:NADH:ubiquinone oxidoreductase subunit 5 (subunit L)/multisubunit Na+/H+ antiporter MnhA subunit
MADLGVLFVALIIVGLPLALLFWGLGRTARHTAESASSVFNALGALLVVVGFIALFWTQVTFKDRHVPGAARWDVATGPLLVIGVGLLVCIGALILSAVQDRERSRGTRV